MRGRPLLFTSYQDDQALLPKTSKRIVVALFLVLLVVIPVIVLLSGGVLAAVLGFFLGRDADARYEGSELLELDD